MSRELIETDFRKSVRLIFETHPFLIMQGGVLSGFTAFLTAWGTFFYWISSGIHNVMGLILLYVFAITIPIFAFRIVRQYVLYMIKAAHVAVLTRLILGEPVSNINMVAYGKNQIQQQFSRMNVFFLVDELVNNVVDALNYFLEALLPLPKESQIRKIIQSVVRSSYTNIEEAILSYNLSRPTEDVWVSARDGLVLYAQNYRAFLIKALKFVVLEWILTYTPTFILVLTFMLTKNPSLAAVSSGILFLGLWTLVIRHALFQPLLMTMILLSFQNIALTQSPDHEWENKLNQISDAFRLICNKVSENEVYDQASGFGN